LSTNKKTTPLDGLGVLKRTLYSYFFFFKDLKNFRASLASLLFGFAGSRTTRIFFFFSFFLAIMDTLSCKDFLEKRYHTHQQKTTLVGWLFEIFSVLFRSLGLPFEESRSSLS